MRRMLNFINEYRVLILVLTLVGAQVGTWVAIRAIDDRIDRVHTTILRTACGGYRDQPCRVTVVPP